MLKPIATMTLGLLLLTTATVTAQQQELEVGQEQKPLPSGNQVLEVPVQFRGCWSGILVAEHDQGEVQLCLNPDPIWKVKQVDEALIQNLYRRTAVEKIGPDWVQLVYESGGMVPGQGTFSNQGKIRCRLENSGRMFCALEALHTQKAFLHPIQHIPQSATVELDREQ